MMMGGEVVGVLGRRKGLGRGADAALYSCLRQLSVSPAHCETTLGDFIASSRCLRADRAAPTTTAAYHRGVSCELEYAAPCL